MVNLRLGGELGVSVLLGGEFGGAYVREVSLG